MANTTSLPLFATPWIATRIQKIIFTKKMLVALLKCNGPQTTLATLVLCMKNY